MPEHSDTSIASRPKVVAFDVIGTTFSLEPLRERLVSLRLPSTALELWLAAGLRDAFALAAADRFAPFQSVLSDALNQVLSLYGIGTSAAERRAVLEIMKQLPPYPDAAEAFEALSQAGIRIFAISNGSASSTEALLDSAGLSRWVERVVSVEEVGFSKPRREVYLHAARLAEVAPSDLALVTTHAWDVQGAKAAGLKAGFVARGQPFPSVMDRPDVQGQSLAEMARRLAGLEPRMDHGRTHVLGAGHLTLTVRSPVVSALAVGGVGLAVGAALAWRGWREATSDRPQTQRRPGSTSPAKLAPATAARTYLPYSDDVEVIEPDEQETFEQIIAVMRKGGEVTRRRYGHAVRTSHAKAHGLVTGELRVMQDLVPELRQGLFAEPRIYPVLVRLSHVPGELLDDRKVSTPRGMALKVVEVEGEMLPGHRGQATQDWVLDTGKVFIAPDAKTFLAQITATEMAMPLPEGVKGAVSTTSLVANKALNAIGLESANLDFYGHPVLHPLAEAYFSQCPLRYGDYIGKLGVFPDTHKLREMMSRELDLDDEDGLQRVVVDFFRENSAEYVVAIQLCTDLERMPVENTNVEWPEEVSPYCPVARLILPPQEAYGETRRLSIDDGLSFCPAHSLAAHRPLGSIMRARMRAYEVLGRERREANGRPLMEPRNRTEIPV